MPNVHSNNPLSYRPPVAVRAFLLERAARTGESFGAIITAALEAARAADLAAAAALRVERDRGQA